MKRDPRFAAHRWGRFFHGLVLTVLLSGNFLLAFLVIMPLFGLEPADINSPSPAAFGVAAVMIALSLGVVIGIGLLWFGRVGVAEIGWRFDQIGRDLLFGLLGLVGMIGSVVVTMAIFGRLDIGGMIEEVSSYSPAQRLLFLLIGVGAALAEESLFRGYIQTALVGKLGLAGGIAVGALVFAVYHLPLSPHPMGLLAKLLFQPLARTSIPGQ